MWENATTVVYEQLYAGNPFSSCAIMKMIEKLNEILFCENTDSFRNLGKTGWSENVNIN